LVWNVADGWEPICKFLNVPIPEKPIPKANQTNDVGFLSNWYRSRLTKSGKKSFTKYAITALLSVIFVYSLFFVILLTLAYFVFSY